MNGNVLIQYMLSEWQNTSWLEITAVFFAVCEVLLAYKNKIWLYPAGIISVCIYIWIFVQPTVRLYADASLNSYYLAMSIYGWVIWGKRNAGKEAVKIEKASQKERLVAFAIFSAAFVLMYFVLKYWTDSNTPVADAFVSSVAWSGMWLLAKRKIENWIVLNISNAAAIPLLFYKHLPLTALLTVFLFVVAVFGYLKWKQLLKATGQKNRVPSVEKEVLQSQKINH